MENDGIRYLYGCSNDGIFCEGSTADPRRIEKIYRDMKIKGAHQVEVKGMGSVQVISIEEFHSRFILKNNSD
jgi:hypothetical protein